VVLAALTWLGAVGLLVLGREHFVGVAAKPVYLGVELVSLAIAARSVAPWVQRRRSPRTHHVAAFAVLFFQVAAVVGAYKGPGPMGAAWDLARLALVGMYATLAVVEGALWISSTKSSS
jgi:uncharacterized membrane protein